LRERLEAEFGRNLDAICADRVHRRLVDHRQRVNRFASLFGKSALAEKLNLPGPGSPEALRELLPTVIGTCRKAVDPVVQLILQLPFVSWQHPRVSQRDELAFPGEAHVTDQAIAFERKTAAARIELTLL
jgi:hypothetical protein